MEAAVDIIGPSGDFVRIAGEGAGLDGIWLLTDVEGLVDPVSEAITKTPASRPGTRFISSRITERTLTFKVGIENDGDWYERDNRWRRLWAFDKYSEFVVTAEDGHRRLKCRLEEIEVDTTFDPRTNKMTEVAMTVVADDPFFYANDEVAEVEGSDSSEHQAVALHNSTGRGVYPRFVLSVRGLSDPDSPVSIMVGDQELALPAPLHADFDWVVDTDPAARQIMDDAEYPVWQRMNGRRLLFSVPSGGWIRSLGVKGSGTFSYQLQARIAQPFDRPWGDV